MQMSPLEVPVLGCHQQPTATAPQTVQTPSITVTGPLPMNPHHQASPYTILRSQPHLDPPALNNATNPGQYQQTTTRAFGPFAPRGTARVPICIMGRGVTFINGHMHPQEYEDMHLEEARARVEKWMEECRRLDCPGFWIAETPVVVQR